MCGCSKKLAAPRAPPAPRAAPAPRPAPAPRAAPAPRPVHRAVVLPMRSSPFRRMLSGRKYVPPPQRTRHGVVVRDTSVWGSLLWRAIHTAIERAPSAASAIASALTTSLPCPDCDKHYNQWYSSHPLNEANPRAWFTDLHNNVNQRTGKPVWTPEQVTTEYSTEESHVAAKQALKELTPILGPAALSALRAALV